jgi:hypothetical protein
VEVGGRGWVLSQHDDQSNGSDPSPSGGQPWTDKKLDNSAMPRIAMTVTTLRFHAHAAPTMERSHDPISSFGVPLGLRLDDQRRLSIRTGHGDETPGLQLLGEDDENLRVGHLGRDGAKPLDIRLGEQGGFQLLGRGRSLGSRLPGSDTREFLRGGVNFSLLGFLREVDHRLKPHGSIECDPGLAGLRDRLD